MSKKLSGAGELALIAALRARAGRPCGAVRVGIGDDAAVLRVGADEEIVVTTDFSLEGRHFRRDWHPAASAGWRCVMRGLSDIAAMGATPASVFLSLAVPRGEAGSAYLRGFLDGVLQAAASAKTQLCGGDTAEAPGEFLLADLTVVGRVPRREALLRSEARAGDRLYCTGMLGGAAAELEALSAKPRRFHQATAAEEHPHLFPRARLAAGVALRAKKLASACMDLSDGLSSDLAQMCEASGVAAEVEAARLPVHRLAAAMGAEKGLRLALDGGEDYELLFTARPGVEVPRRVGGVAVTEIGRMVARTKGRPQVTLVGADGRRQALKRGGWEHLR